MSLRLSTRDAAATTSWRGTRSGMTGAAGTGTGAGAVLPPSTVETLIDFETMYPSLTTENPAFGWEYSLRRESEEGESDAADDDDNNDNNDNVESKEEDDDDGARRDRPKPKALMPRMSSLRTKLESRLSSLSASSSSSASRPLSARLSDLRNSLRHSLSSSPMNPKPSS